VFTVFLLDFHHFFKDNNGEQRIAYMNNNNSNNTFIVTPFDQTYAFDYHVEECPFIKHLLTVLCCSSNQNNSAVLLTVRDGQGQINSEVLSKKESGEWSDEHGNTGPSLEKLVDDIMVQKGFRGI
jgi:hypothetical protein